MGVQPTSTLLKIEPGSTPDKAKVTVSYDLAITENAYKSDWFVHVEIWGDDFAGDDEGPGQASEDILHTFTFPDTKMPYYIVKADGPTRLVPKEHTVELPYQVLNEDPGARKVQLTFPNGRKRTLLLPHTDEISAKIWTQNIGWTNQVTLLIL